MYVHTLSQNKSNVGESHQAGSIFCHLSLMGGLPRNMATHSSGRSHTCNLLNCCHKTNDPSKLLTSKPHNTVTENLLWKLLTCLMWISMRPRMQISFIIYTIPRPGAAYWLRHCATSQKVPGSIPGRVTGDFFRGI
jgi:hypothetical protein